MILCCWTLCREAFRNLCLISPFQTCRSVEATVKEAQKEAEKIHIDVSTEKDSLSILLNLLRQMAKLKNSLKPLMNSTMPSSLFNIVTLNVLKSSQGLKKPTPELMVTLSKLLRSDLHVESARIPEELSVRKTAVRYSFYAKRVFLLLSRN